MPWARRTAVAIALLAALHLALALGLAVAAPSTGSWVALGARRRRGADGDRPLGPRRPPSRRSGGRRAARPALPERSRTWSPRRSGSGGWPRRVPRATGPGWSPSRPRTPGGCWRCSPCSSCTSPTAGCRRARWRWVPPVLVVSAAAVQAYGAFEATPFRPPLEDSGPSLRPAARVARGRRPRVLPDAAAVPGVRRLAGAALPARRPDPTPADQVAGAGGHRDAAVPAALPARDPDLGRPVLGQRRRRDRLPRGHPGRGRHRGAAPRPVRRRQGACPRRHLGPAHRAAARRLRGRVVGHRAAGRPRLARRGGGRHRGGGAGAAARTARRTACGRRPDVPAAARGARGRRPPAPRGQRRPGPPRAAPGRAARRAARPRAAGRLPGPGVAGLPGRGG